MTKFKSEKMLTRWQSVVTFICIAIVTLLFFVFVMRKQKAPLNSVMIGERMSQISMYYSDGTKYEHSANSIAVYFYLDMACGICTEQLPYIARMINIFADDRLEIEIVWANEIPDNNTIENRHQLTLRGEERLASVTPYMFVVSSENIVLFTGTLNFNSLTQYLMSLSSNEYTAQAIRELKRLGYIQEQTSTVIFFSAVNCFSCEEEYEKLKQAYECNFVVITEEEITSIEQIYDPMIFANIFHVQAYPSCIWLNSDAEIVGKR